MSSVANLWIFSQQDILGWWTLLSSFTAIESRSYDVDSLSLSLSLSLPSLYLSLSLNNTPRNKDFDAWQFWKLSWTNRGFLQWFLLIILHSIPHSEIQCVMKAQYFIDVHDTFKLSQSDCVCKFLQLVSVFRNMIGWNRVSNCPLRSLNTSRFLKWCVWKGFFLTEWTENESDSYPASCSVPLWWDIDFKPEFVLNNTYSVIIL